MACSAERHEASPNYGNTSGGGDSKAQNPDIYLVTVPLDAAPGQQLLINTAQGQMRVQIPPGVGPGQQFRASVPRVRSNPPRNTGALSAIPVDNPFQNQPTITAFEVRGAGTEVVNGVYTADRIVDGVQAYRKQGTNIMLHRYPSLDRSGTTVWWIADWGVGGQPADNDDTDYYFVNSHLSLPPQSGWRHDEHCRGVHPPPSVLPHGVTGMNSAAYTNYTRQHVRNTRGGAPMQIIRSLPESKYTKKMAPKDGKDSATNEKCCICLNDFEEGETIIRLPCLHIFHKEEISKWLLKNHKCPLCNTSILRGFMIPEEAKT